MRTAKTLIRLGGCPGWSESSLGAEPHCWFCHVAAHLCFIKILERTNKSKALIFQINSQSRSNSLTITELLYQPPPQPPPPTPSLKPGMIQYAFFVSQYEISALHWKAEQNYTPNPFSLKTPDSNTSFIMHQLFVTMDLEGLGVAGEMCQVFTFASSLQCKVSVGICFYAKIGWITAKLGKIQQNSRDSTNCIAGFLTGICWKKSQSHCCSVPRGWG